MRTKPAMARRLVAIEIVWPAITSRSNCNEMLGGTPALAGVIASTRPKTLLPALIRAPAGSGTSCMILPEMAWPGLDFSGERVERNSIGRMVPAGMEKRPDGSAGVAGFG